MADDDLTTIHIDFTDGTAVRYVVDADNLELARDRAHEKIASLKNGVRKMPDYTKDGRKKINDFVMDCGLLCIASERRGKGILKGTVIKDFHLLDGADLPQFGTA